MSGSPGNYRPLAGKQSVMIPGCFREYVCWQNISSTYISRKERTWQELQCWVGLDALSSSSRRGNALTWLDLSSAGYGLWSIYSYSTCSCQITSALNTILIKSLSPSTGSGIWIRQNLSLYILNTCKAQPWPQKIVILGKSQHYSTN